MPSAPPPPLLSGREAERVALVARLGAPEGRLVTLAGPAGVGKTALAAAVAHDLGAAGRRVVWVDLSDTARPDLARRLLRAALGVPVDAAEPAALAAALAATPPALLVIDGLDAVVAPLAAELDQLALRLATEGSVLVTSRQRLHTTAEALVTLGGLGPDAGAALFSRAAGGARPEVARHIAVVLEGLPLALLLAGARAAVLGPDEVAARLDGALELLAAPLANVPPRHRSMRAALDVAWALLEPDARRALAACAAFAGPFAADAAEVVIGPPDPLGALAALVDASWLVTCDGADGRRFRVPGLARAYALEADPSAAAAAGGRHASWFAARAEAAWRAVDHGQVQAWRRRLAADGRELWHVAMHAADPSRRANVAIVLGIIVDDRDAAMQHEAAALGLAGHPAGEIAARLLEIRARARRGLGRLADARADLDAAVAAAAGSAVLPFMLAQRAVAHVHLGDVGAAAADIARAHRLLADGTPAFIRFMVESTGAVLDYERGDVAAAEPVLERMLGEALALDAPAAAAEIAGILGNLAHRAGRLRPARDRLAEAAQGAAAAGAVRLAAIFEGYVALVDHEAGRAEDALAGYERSIAALARCGSRRHEALFRAARAGLLATLDRAPEQARRDLAVAAHVAAERGAPQLCAAVASFREIARARWDDLPAAPVATGVGEADDDLLIARRMSARALDELAAAPVLAVAPGCAAVRPDSGAEVIDLSRRPPLRRVLAALVAAHGEAPGRLLDAAALQAAGWPGERMLAEAGRQRVRVAVWTLRRMGLKALIETEGGAYRLSPRVVIGEL